MTLTLLLDLDDTLLDSNMDNFIPVYFQALGKAMAAHVDPQLLLKYLMLGSQAMEAHDSPTETLEAVFSKNFYPYLGVERDILDPEIDRFYAEIFPTLSYLTKPRPEAVEFVQWAVARGYRIVIATNPLFPQVAVTHRLRWAGLAPEDYPFEVISSFEQFHFCKPNPAYLAEILGLLGFPDDPVLMVGDDPVRDVQAAEGLGIPMYWIAAADAELPEGSNPVMGQGSIGELRAWLEARDESDFTAQYQARTAVVATMKSIPAILRSLVADLPDERWCDRPDAEEWCLNEILAHLRDVEREVNLPRLQTFLNEENPFITADDTDLWVSEREYSAQDGRTALKEFIAARMETLNVLAGLNEADWQRAARHAIFGPITLEEQLGFVAEHDRVHIRQLYAILDDAK
mgnify:CR=1 FL=1